MCRLGETAQQSGSRNAAPSIGEAPSHAADRFATTVVSRLTNIDWGA
jgi:hypothetical protein